MFINLFQQNQFKQSSQKFIVDLKSDGISIIDENDENIDYQNRKLTIFVYGDLLSNDEIEK